MRKLNKINKEPYVKPVIKPIKNMMFMFDGMKAVNTCHGCRQCSSCHGCR